MTLGRSGMKFADNVLRRWAVINESPIDRFLLIPAWITWLLRMSFLGCTGPIKSYLQSFNIFFQILNLLFKVLQTLRGWTFISGGFGQNKISWLCKVDIYFVFEYLMSKGWCFFVNYWVVSFIVAFRGWDGLLHSDTNFIIFLTFLNTKSGSNTQISYKFVTDERVILFILLFLLYLLGQSGVCWEKNLRRQVGWILGGVELINKRKWFFLGEEIKSGETMILCEVVGSGKVEGGHWYII